MTNINELQKKYASDNFVSVTTDVDWASEDCIKELLDFFLERNIPLTVFCTHKSKMIDRYKKNPLITLGIHPNFCENSSQGKSYDEVIKYCTEIVPDAISFRCHRWFDTNDIYDKLVPKGFLYESNSSSLMCNVPPYIHRSGILRIPVFFEDGGYIFHNPDMRFESSGRKYFDAPGLKVLDLHPIHFAVNTPYFTYTREIKDRLTREEYNCLDKDAVQKIRNNKRGIRTYIEEMTGFILSEKINVVSLPQIYKDLKQI